MPPKKLGRGLSALLSKPADSAPAAEETTVPTDRFDLPVAEIRISPYQPRRDFKESELDELAASIAEHGVLQPVTVRRLPDDGYELIAGERRLRASQRAGLTTIPIRLIEASDEKALEVALIENIQRADLNAIEEAEGYQQLQEKFQLTQEQVAQRVGKARASVANTLRLLELAPDVRGLVSGGMLSVGHAKVLLAIKDAELQRIAAQRVIAEGLSVRATEQWVARHAAGNEKGKPSAKPRATTSDTDPQLRQLQEKIRERLGTQVNLRGAGGRGKIEIEYYNLDDLDRVLAVLGVSLD
jgi:ParB family chromosome partitioning protein